MRTCCSSTQSCQVSSLQSSRWISETCCNSTNQKIIFLFFHVFFVCCSCSCYSHFCYCSSCSSSCSSCSVLLVRFVRVFFFFFLLSFCFFVLIVVLVLLICVLLPFLVRVDVLFIELIVLKKCKIILFPFQQCGQCLRCEIALGCCVFSSLEFIFVIVGFLVSRTLMPNSFVGVGRRLGRSTWWHGRFY